tara:strand:+ start:1175 stop:1348 length:174 start_codon:yes stop_codon:yes gene_type:complete
MIAKIIIILLYTLSLGMNIKSHGEERKPTNGWASFIGYLIIMGLLYWAGLFDNFQTK